MTKKEAIALAVNLEMERQGWLTTYSLNKSKKINKQSLDRVRGKGKLKEQDFMFSTLVEVLEALDLNILIY